ncbi:MAG: type IV secretion system protein VirB10 [Methylotenera sp.]
MTNNQINVLENANPPEEVKQAASYKTDIQANYQPQKNWLGLLLIITVPLMFAGTLYVGYSKLKAHQTAQKNDKKSQKVIIENKVRSLGAEGDPIQIAPVDQHVAIAASTAVPMPITEAYTATPIPVVSNQTATARTGMQNTRVMRKISRYDAPIVMAHDTASLTNDTPIGNTGLVSNTDAYAPPNKPVLNETRANGLQLVPTATAKAKARLLGNRNYILTKGNTFDCALESAINSSNPGLVTCTTTSNSYSDNGKVVLVERGSLLTGEYTGLKQGDTRLAVLWERIKTPEGVVIELNSLGTDALGRSGFDGDVDKHWLERVGAAIFLSTFKDLVAYETAKNSNGTTIAFPSAQRSGEDVASQILKQSINLPPTLTKNQGERITILVARDLDFSDVYALTMTNEDN